MKGQEMREQLLRCQNNLIISGLGIILLGVWSIVKGILVNLQARDRYLDVLSETGSETLTMAAVVIFTVIFIAISFGARLYIGRSAVAEARGKRKGNKYLILSGILCTVNIIGILLTILMIRYAGEALSETIAVLIVDITVVFTYIELMFSALKMRKIRDISAEGEAQCS